MNYRKNKMYFRQEKTIPQKYLEYLNFLFKKIHKISLIFAENMTHQDTVEKKKRY